MRKNLEKIPENKAVNNSFQTKIFLLSYMVTKIIKVYNTTKPAKSLHFSYFQDYFGRLKNGQK